VPAELEAADSLRVRVPGRHRRHGYQVRQSAANEAAALGLLLLETQQEVTRGAQPGELETRCLGGSAPRISTWTERGSLNRMVLSYN
jgi:hypothetical protein